MILSVASTVAKENIVSLEISHRVAHVYLPINVGAEFPSVQWYIAIGLGIIGISKDNFAGMTKTKTIQLGANKITSISSDTFLGLTSLDFIDLSKLLKNVSVKNNFFNPVAGDNPLTRIGGTNIFEGLISLHNVYMNSGCIVVQYNVESSTDIDVPGNNPHTCKLIPPRKSL